MPKKAQSIIEYSIVLGLAVAVFIAMQTYLKRSIQQGIRISADQLGSQSGGLPYTSPRDGQVVESRSQANTALPTQKNKIVYGSGRQMVSTDEIKDTDALSTNKRMDDGWYYVDESLYGGSNTLHRRRKIKDEP